MNKLSFALFVLAPLGGCSRWSSFDTLEHVDAQLAPIGADIEGGQGIALGTPVRVVLTSTIHSEDDSAETASFVVLHDVHAVDGSVALAAGSPVAVHVRYHRRRRMGRPAEIIVDAVGAIAPNGTLVPLRGRARVLGASRRGLAAGMTIGMTMVYWPFSALHLLQRGDAAQMQSGFVLEATVAL